MERCCWKWTGTRINKQISDYSPRWSQYVNT